MRHNVYGKKLGRNKDERDVLFKSLVHNLFSYGTIQTSATKAKAIKGLVDKIITLAKNKNSQRLVQSYLTNKLLQERLIKEIAPKMANRVSGYTSTVKMGRRAGDNTMVVKMSLIGVEELKPVEKQVTGNRGQVTVKETTEKKVAAKKAVKASKSKSSASKK